MEPFRYHVYICDQQKPEGLPGCCARGSRAVIEAMRKEIAARRLGDEVQITICGSLGVCERGPNMVVYPEGAWYSGVQPGDVPEIVQSHFVEGRPVDRLLNRDGGALAAEICAHRDRMVAALRARDAAGMIPDELMQTIRAFQESRVILTALELDLFTAVGDGGGAAEIARRAGTEPRATEMLLNALTALGLLAKRDGVFRNTPTCARYFDVRSPESARMALMHTVHVFERWANLTEKVRGGPAEGAPWTEAFIAAMHYNAVDRAPAVVRAVGVEGVRRMLDIGGGSGAYSIAFARANPGLRADVLDRPEVTAIARRHIQAAGLEERIGTIDGDLTRDMFGKAYDLVLVSAICHMLGPEENQDLLQRCHDALEPGGRVVIQDFILNPDKAGPKSAALFSLNMLVGTERGASYSEQEYVDWLTSARFADIRRIPLPGPTHLVVASRGL